MPLTLPPAQNAVPAPVINSAPTSGLSPQALMMVRSAGVRLSDNALRTSGRLSVTIATRSRITHFNSEVPVSMVVSVVVVSFLPLRGLPRVQLKPPPSYPPPGLALGEPDDRLQRVSSNRRRHSSLSAVAEYWIIRFRG